jgi:hypothetical protein
LPLRRSSQSARCAFDYAHRHPQPFRAANAFPLGDGDSSCIVMCYLPNRIPACEICFMMGGAITAM